MGQCRWKRRWPVSTALPGVNNGADRRNSPLSRVLHRTLFADPVLATRGEGIYLYADGRKIIDGSGGAAVACLGHGHPRINAAIAEQLAKVAYVHTVLFSNEAAEELAE